MALSYDNLDKKPLPDPHRIPEMLRVLKRLWQKEPQLSLGQVILRASGRLDLRLITDETLYERLRRMGE